MLINFITNDNVDMTVTSDELLLSVRSKIITTGTKNVLPVRYFTIDIMLHPYKLLYNNLSDDDLWIYLLDLEYLAVDTYINNLLLYIAKRCTEIDKKFLINKLINQRIDYINIMLDLYPAFYYELVQ